METAGFTGNFSINSAPEQGISCFREQANVSKDFSNIEPTTLICDFIVRCGRQCASLSWPF